MQDTGYPKQLVSFYNDASRIPYPILQTFFLLSQFFPILQLYPTILVENNNHIISSSIATSPVATTGIITTTIISTIR